MKKTLAMTLFFLSLVTPLYAATLAEANAKYQSGDFKAAASLYEEMVKGGKGSGAVYYNLGNAYFRLGVKGKALVNFRRAFERLPRDPDAGWNLDLVRSTVPERSGASEGAWALAWARTTAAFFTLDEICLAITAELVLCLLLILLSVYIPRLGLLPQMVQAVVTMCLIAAAALFAFKAYGLRDPAAVVLEKEVYARYGPSERETKAFLLREGAEVKLLDESKGWLYVSLGEKNPGWVPKASCEVV